MKLLVLIAARRGSKGLRHKNIRKLHGTPLLVRAITLAKESLPRATVVVSTDSKRYAKLAQNAGAEVPFLRPKTLAQDETRLIDVVLHTIEALGAQGRSFDAVMLLSATTPLTTVQDVRKATRIFEKNRYKSVISVTKERSHPSWRYTLIRGYLMAPKGRRVERRQTAAAEVALNGALYIATPAWLLRFRQFCVPGRSLPYVMPQARSLDIESAEDLALAARLV